MNVSIQQTSTATVVTISGRVGPEQAVQLSRRVKSEMHSDRLLIDLSACDGINSRVIGAFLEFQRQLEARDGKMILVRPSKRVTELIDMLRLNELFEYAGSIGVVL